MGRVQGNSGAIASSTNSWGTTLRCLAATRGSSRERKGLFRRGFDIGLYDSAQLSGSAEIRPQQSITSSSASESSKSFPVAGKTYQLPDGTLSITFVFSARSPGISLALRRTSTNQALVFID